MTNKQHYVQAGYLGLIYGEGKERNARSEKISTIDIATWKEEDKIFSKLLVDSFLDKNVEDFYAINEIEKNFYNEINNILKNSNSLYSINPELLNSYVALHESRNIIKYFNLIENLLKAKEINNIIIKKNISISEPDIDLVIQKSSNNELLSSASTYSEKIKANLFISSYLNEENQEKRKDILNSFFNFLYPLYWKNIENNFSKKTNLLIKCDRKFFIGVNIVINYNNNFYKNQVKYLDYLKLDYKIINILSSLIIFNLGNYLIIYFNNEDEKKFFENFLQKYQKDFFYFVIQSQIISSYQKILVHNEEKDFLHKNKDILEPIAKNHNQYYSHLLKSI